MGHRLPTRSTSHTVALSGASLASPGPRGQEPHPKPVAFAQANESRPAGLVSSSVTGLEVRENSLPDPQAPPQEALRKPDGCVHIPKSPC